MSIDWQPPPSRQSLLEPNEIGIVFTLPRKNSRVHRIIKENNEWVQWFYGNHSVSMTNVRCIEDGAFYAIEYEAMMKLWLNKKLEELQIIKNFTIIQTTKVYYDGSSH